MPRMARRRPKAALSLVVVGAGVAALALGAGHAIQDRGPALYRESPLPRPAVPRDVGIQYLGYPYGVAAYPTVPDETEILCYDYPGLHAQGCRLAFDLGPDWGIPSVLPQGILDSTQPAIR